MDVKKFKSVAVSVETYKELQKLAAASERSVSRQITHLVKSAKQKHAA